MKNITLKEKINHVHCIIQELENNSISLPIGSYNDIYSYLEEAREYFETIDRAKELENPYGFSYITKEGYGTWD